MKLKNNITKAWLALILIPPFLTACHSFKPGKEIQPHIAQELAPISNNAKSVAPVKVSSALTQSLLSSLNSEQSLKNEFCLLYTSPSPRDVEESRMPSSA